ncbi:proprotein convertase subtilisin/kexin type 5 [Denticeps clupeoides]|nr:proprotein convertase subtilisin/kexin type 5-like [Denticeps clupeoides]
MLLRLAGLLLPLLLLLLLPRGARSASPVSCPGGQFALKSRCVPCHPTCAECSGHELFDCAACGVDEEGRERFLHQGRCRPHCPRGTYPERGHYVCLACMSDCELCVDAHMCAKCKEGYRLQSGLCQAASCGVGQMQVPETGECVDCEMGCKTCSTDDPELCSSCLEGYFLFRQQCRRHCPQRSYEDRARGLCMSCPAPCSDCRSDTLCLACQPGHFLSDGVCVKQCPQGSFGEVSGWGCQLCHSSCQTCHGPHVRDCDLCPNGNLPVYGQCPAVICKQGQYYDGLDGECHYCHLTCKTCIGPKAQDCSSCFDDYVLDQDGACVEHCLPGSFANPASQMCEECSPNCETCGDASDNCISCKSGSYQLFLHQGRCWSNCPDGFFETAEGMCEACDSECLTCEEKSSQCLSCVEGRFFEIGQCKPNCSQRSYPAEDGTCRRCPPHCDVCADDKACSRCSFLYLLLNGVCKANCPEGYFEDLDEGRCVPCHRTCATCSGPLFDDCESCSDAAPKLYEGTCSKDCPTGTYYETSVQECQECHQTCARCTGPEPTHCTQCGKGLALDPNTMMCGVTGDSDCPPKTFLHGNRFTCQACHRQCQSCEGPGPNDCQTCAVPGYLHNGSCESECPAGTYKASEEADGVELGFCSLCDHVCGTCTGASPKDCLSCSRGYFRLLHLCVSHCPTGYYTEGQHCEKCDRSCELCSGPGPEKCQVCPPSLLELQGTMQCVERCPDRFFQEGQRCTQCHTSCLTCTDNTPQGCLTCDWGSILQDGVCYPRCEERRYFTQNEACELCDNSCRHCSGPGPEHCLTCDPGFALHAVDSRCVRCCESAEATGDCCVCDPSTALCVEAPKAGHLDLSAGAFHHSTVAVPIALLVVLLVMLAVFGLVKARTRRRLCWAQSYERLSGTAGGGLDTQSMPHGVPDPEDSGDEVDVVYTSRGGSVYRRYGFIHDQDTEEEEDLDASMGLSRT